MQNFANAALQAFDLETYTNKEVIAVDQDRLGAQGAVVWTNCAAFVKVSALDAVPACQQIWARPLTGGAVAMNFLNFAATPANITCDAACFRAAGLRRVAVRDVWLHKDLGVFSGAYTAAVDGDGASVTLLMSPN